MAIHGTHPQTLLAWDRPTVRAASTADMTAFAGCLKPNSTNWCFESCLLSLSHGLSQNLIQTSEVSYLPRNNGPASRMIHREMSIDIIDDSYSSSIIMADTANEESQVR